MSAKPEAGTMINFDTPILDIDGRALAEDGFAIDAAEHELPKMMPNGQPFLRGNPDPVTLGSISCTALLANYEDEKGLSGKKKAERFALALKANKGGEQPLSATEIVLIKAVIEKAFGPLYVGRALEILGEKPSE